MRTNETTSCSISDDWSYKEMQVVFLENEFLKIGILPGRGSDIFEFCYKPQQLDPLLRLSRGIGNPAQGSQLPEERGRFEEFYYGGWQEALPNSPSFNYRGAVLGQHGELALQPWKYSILMDTAEEVQLKVWTELLKLPLRLEKTLRLKKGEAQLHISERLLNQGGTDLDIMWGHHLAFGLPFLQEGAQIETNASHFIAEPNMPAKRRFLPGKTFPWPQGEDLHGSPSDASKIPPVTAAPYSELCYLQGYKEEAYYRLHNEERDLSFELRWNGELFKCLWLWQERYATQDYPWWGKCYTVALEPWTSAGTPNPHQAIEEGDWLKIKAGQVIETELSAGFLPGKE